MIAVAELRRSHRPQLRVVRGGRDVVLFDNRTASPSVLARSAGYQGVDSSHNLRLRFEIPQNFMGIQRALLSFSLQAWRASQQSTANGSTSGSGGASTPTSGANNTSHFHSMSLANETISNPVQYDGTGAVLAVTGGGSLTTSLDSANHSHNVSLPNHTHSVPSLSLQAPTGLVDQAMAQAVHVLIAKAGGSFTDITSALGGPWGAGSALDVNDLDISQYVTAGGWWEVQLSSATLGGIIANVDLFGMVGAL